MKNMTDYEPARVPPPAKIILRELAARIGQNTYQLDEVLFHICLDGGAIDEDAAAILADAFGTTPELWLALQAGYDESGLPK